MITYGRFLGQLEKQLDDIGVEKGALAYVFQKKKDWNKTTFVLKLNQEMSEKDQQLLQNIYQQLSEHYPPQYILKEVIFHENRLKIDERALIPRPETEELVNLILKENTTQALRVLDIGTGSGAIAISLKKSRPDWNISAIDLSKEALSLAKENAKNLNVDIWFHQSDIFSDLSGMKFDIIVSNPPYIAREDKHEVDKNVLEYEPHMALFADDNGLAIYHKILEQANDYLLPNGKIYFEIGYRQGKELLSLAEHFFSSKRSRVIKDSFNQDRMVIIDDVR